MSKTTASPTQCPAVKTTPSLLQRLGGETALDALVGAFYFNVLLDERVAHFYVDADIEAICNHQRKFLATALGGQDEYRGRHLRQAHRALVQAHGLDQSHFDATAEILASTLHQFGHAAELTQNIVDRVTALRADVLGTRL